MKYFILISISFLFSNCIFSQDDNINEILAGMAPCCFLVKHQKLETIRISNISKCQLVPKESIKYQEQSDTIKLACPPFFNTRLSDLLYILDGNIVNPDDVNTDSVESIQLLQPPASIAIFGTEGRNGAMVITTKKSKLFKVKNLDTVTVRSYYGCRRVCTSVCCVAGVRILSASILSTSVPGSIKQDVSSISTLKIFPNPVQRGNTINISFKLKQTGNHNIQITDASGRIVLQKQTNIPSKEYIEYIQTDSRWNSGVYYIRVSDNKNKPISSSKFIVQ